MSLRATGSALAVALLLTWGGLLHPGKAAYVRGSPPMQGLGPVRGLYPLSEPPSMHNGMLPTPVNGATRTPEMRPVREPSLVKRTPLIRGMQTIRGQSPLNRQTQVHGRPPSRQPPIHRIPPMRRPSPHNRLPPVHGIPPVRKPSLLNRQPSIRGMPQMRPSLQNRQLLIHGIRLIRRPPQLNRQRPIYEMPPLRKPSIPNRQTPIHGRPQMRPFQLTRPSLIHGMRLIRRPPQLNRQRPIYEMPPVRKPFQVNRHTREKPSAKIIIVAPNEQPRAEGLQPNTTSPPRDETDNIRPGHRHPPVELPYCVILAPPSNCKQRKECWTTQDNGDCVQDLKCLERIYGMHPEKIPPPQTEKPVVPFCTPEIAKFCNCDI